MSKRISRFTIHRSDEPCTKCGAIGHNKRACTAKEAPKIPYRKYLEVNRLAWQGLSPSDIVCVRCDGKGHKAESCTQTREEEGEEGGDFTEVVVSHQTPQPIDDSPPCRNCGEDHKTADCYHTQFDENVFTIQKNDAKNKVIPASHISSLPSAFDLPLTLPPSGESSGTPFPAVETSLGTTVILKKPKKRKASGVGKGKKKKKKRKKGILVGYDSESE